MRQLIKVLGSLLLVLGMPVTMAHAQGDPVAGEEKAAMCGGCHGADGNSEDPSFPHLAGQYADYIVKQILDFQTGHRANNETMAGMAAMVASLDDAKDIAAYFARQKIKDASLTTPDPKLLARGESP